MYSFLALNKKTDTVIVAQLILVKHVREWLCYTKITEHLWLIILMSLLDANREHRIVSEIFFSFHLKIALQNDFYIPVIKKCLLQGWKVTIEYYAHYLGDEINCTPNLSITWYTYVTNRHITYPPNLK